MRRFSTTRRVRHSASNMFDLVADVEAYPEFLPLCKSLTITGRERLDGHDVIIASMEIGYKAVRETFLSRVTLNRPGLRIDVDYVEGPATHLTNRWLFRDLAAGRSEIDFHLEYAFRNPALGLVMGTVFDLAFGRFAESFEARADVIYRK